MEDILARLEMDSRPVSRRLVSLIFNSFLPVNQPEEVWCERCVALIQMNHAAARRFYQYAHEHTACTNIGLEPATSALLSSNRPCAFP
jgi:condensin-2 complex subunit G2